MKHKTSSKNELTVALIAIGAILFLESLALYKGIDGTMFGAAMVAIGGVAGYFLKAHIKD